MRIGEASRAVGVSARSLRFYEAEGLITPGRRHNGYRDYCRSTVERVLVIRSLLEAGLPMRLIREALPAEHDRTEPSAVGSPAFVDDVRRYRDQLATRIRTLEEQRSAIDAFLGSVEREGPSQVRRRCA